MKHIVVALICVGISVIFWQGCKKSQAAASDSVVGSWELRKTTAAMNPNAQIYPPGNGNILKFTSTTNYERYENGSLVNSGTFEIVNDNTVEQSVCLVIPAGQYTRRIIYDGDLSAAKTFIETTGNTISFISGCYAYDAGHTAEYGRSK